MSGERDTPLAELWVFAAHPTLLPRDGGMLDPDWPGRLARARERAGGVALVVQGPVGNASASAEPGAAGAEAYARAIAAQAEEIPLRPLPAPSLGFSRVRVALPRPDASRLVPRWARIAGDNFLCGRTQRTAEIGALQLGPLRLLTLPAEPTSAAAALLERATGAGRVLGLADGYLGYVELPEAVETRRGEARRQYFGPHLLERLARGAAVAMEAAAAGARGR